MAIFKQCNICGKNETHRGTIFSEECLKLIVPSYEGKDYTVYLHVGAEYVEDSKRIEEYKKKMQDPEQLYKMMIASNIAKNTETKEGTPPKGVMIPLTEPIKIEEPYPLICDACKKGLSLLLLKHGKYKKGERF